MKRTGPINLLLVQGKVIFQKHLIPELGIPIILGLLVTGIIRIIFSYFSISDSFTVLIETVIFLLFTFTIYMLLTFMRLYNVSRNTTYQLPSDYNFRSLVNTSTEFFCTSVIPLVLKDFSTWFTSEMIESFSFIINKRIEDKTYKACRVLIFINKKQPHILKTFSFFDCSYARRVANIHKNFGVDIAFLSFEKFIEICNNKMDINQLDKKQFDMAIFQTKSSLNVLIANSIRSESFINPIREVNYSLVQDVNEKKSYIDIMFMLKNELYDSTGLKSEYDFYRFLFNS